MVSSDLDNIIARNWCRFDSESTKDESERAGYLLPKSAISAADFSFAPASSPANADAKPSEPSLKSERGMYAMFAKSPAKI